MTNRYQPNEAAAPIDLDTLALLLRSGAERVRSLVGSMNPLERARLAVFCVGRCHMRKLGLEIAALCDERSLWLAAGPLGAALFEQSRDAGSFDKGPSIDHKKPISLARLAA
ncbi:MULTISPECIES: hypothetical protein [unclassified Aureimonas]|uniref:hypothetical protein n=1 Tax=unclassified Aureimonas TaxID=2615206 RepID=UPI0006FB0959|nr:MULTISPECIES: hypothetical protein [unclassified Aureimonas]KQT69035.1 hypothetical protein ASG54_05115 [Aureimonas sp. Leaf460]KQT69270.1 hypothetical protein ASG62_17725 [Aureimonas sp. Leaf427]